MLGNRFEFKYELNPALAMRARDLVASFLSHDSNATSIPYTVTSLYFETPTLGDFYDKSGGFLMRKKIRARIYDTHMTADTKSIWLETKQKYDMAFNKTRILLPRDEWDLLERGAVTKLLNLERGEKEQRALEQFLFFVLYEARTPQYFIRYKREAFISPAPEQLRVTFDTDIECADASTLREPAYIKQLTHDTVMEVKFRNRLPGWFGDIIRTLNLQRQSFSKYGRSVEALHEFRPLPR